MMITILASFVGYSSILREVKTLFELAPIVTGVNK